MPDLPISGTVGQVMFACVIAGSVAISSELRVRDCRTFIQLIYSLTFTNGEDTHQVKNQKKKYSLHII